MEHKSFTSGPQMWCFAQIIGYRCFDASPCFRNDRKQGWSEANCLNIPKFRPCGAKFNVKQGESQQQRYPLAAIGVSKIHDRARLPSFLTFVSSSGGCFENLFSFVYAQSKKIHSPPRKRGELSKIESASVIGNLVSSKTSGWKGCQGTRISFPYLETIVTASERRI